MLPIINILVAWLPLWRAYVIYVFALALLSAIIYIISTIWRL